jgi:hypothetical protein
MLPLLRVLPLGGGIIAVLILVLALTPPDRLRQAISPVAFVAARGPLIDADDHPEWRQFVIQAAARRADELDRLRVGPDTLSVPIIAAASVTEAAIEPQTTEAPAEEPQQVIASLPNSEIETGQISFDESKTTDAIVESPPAIEIGSREIPEPAPDDLPVAHVAFPKNRPIVVVLPPVKSTLGKHYPHARRAAKLSSNAQPDTFNIFDVHPAAQQPNAPEKGADDRYFGTNINLTAHSANGGLSKPTTAANAQRKSTITVYSENPFAQKTLSNSAPKDDSGSSN